MQEIVVAPLHAAPNEQLKALARAIQGYNHWLQTPNKSSVCIDLQDARFISPALLVGLSALWQCIITSAGQKPDFKFPANAEANSYLKTVGLCNEYNTMDGFPSGKTYIPILKLPVLANSITSRLGVDDAILRLLGTVSKGIPDAIFFIISEMLDNIEQHTQSDFAWVCSQYYGTIRCLDICIADTGLTLLGAYKNAGFDEIKSDAQAIEAALSGKSIKEDKDQGRGHGLRTSKRFTIEGLAGEFRLWSGRGYYQHLSNQNSGKVSTLGPDLFFPGTIIWFRLRNQSLDLHQYHY